MLESLHRNNIKLVAFDLDGSLLNSKRKVGKKDLAALKQMRKDGVITVAATGRNFKSALSVLKPNFQADYLVFSNGAGVAGFSNHNIIQQSVIPSEQTNDVIRLLKQEECSFEVHAPIPDNHLFRYYRNANTIKDFWRRLSMNRNNVISDKHHLAHAGSSQIVAFFDTDMMYLQNLSKKFQDVSIHIVKSAIDHKSWWFEILPKNAYKSSGIATLLHRYGISENQMLCLGNDRNDIDMLKMAKYSFVVSNAVPELLEMFPASVSNNENPLTHILLNCI